MLSQLFLENDSEPAFTIKAVLLQVFCGKRPSAALESSADVYSLLERWSVSCMSGSVDSPFPCRPLSCRLPCLLCSKWCPCPFPCPCPLPLRVPRRSFSRPWDGLFILIRTLSLSLLGPISNLTGLKLSSPVPSSSGLASGCTGLWESSPAPALAPREPGPPCPPRSLLERWACKPCRGCCRVLVPAAEVCACLLLP